jgi:hypothetical protein
MAEIAETDHIERDLAKTRARMDRRLDELGDHLAPKQIVNDALAYFKGADGADFTQDMISKVKANPLPVVLTGVGIAWLMASSTRPASTAPKQAAQRQSEITTRLRSAEAGVHRAVDEQPDDYASRLDDARGEVLGIAKSAADTAADYAARIRQATAEGALSVSATSSDITEKASAAASGLSKSAQRGGASFMQEIGNMAQSIRDTFLSVPANPLALGAIAAVVGLVAGALIPATEQEERALGGTADRLRTAGRDLAQDVVDRGGQVASDVIGAAQESAQAHGLTADKPVGEAVSDLKSGALVDAVKQVATETIDAGKDSAQSRFAPPPERPENDDSPVSSS